MTKDIKYKDEHFIVDGNRVYLDETVWFFLLAVDPDLHEYEDEYDGNTGYFESDLRISDEPFEEALLAEQKNKDEGVAVRGYYYKCKEVGNKFYLCSHYLEQIFGEIPDTIYFKIL